MSSAAARRRASLASTARQLVSSVAATSGSTPMITRSMGRSTAPRRYSTRIPRTLENAARSHRRRQTRRSIGLAVAKLGGKRRRRSTTALGWRGGGEPASPQTSTPGRTWAVLSSCALAPMVVGCAPQPASDRVREVRPDVAAHAPATPSRGGPVAGEPAGWSHDPGRSRTLAGAVVGGPVAVLDDLAGSPVHAHTMVDRRSSRGLDAVERSVRGRDQLAWRPTLVAGRPPCRSMR